MDSPMDKYVKALKYDIKIADTYFRKSVEKTEQQKQLENLLSNDKVFLNATEIVDIACGGGTLSYHLAKLNTKAEFYLLDILEEALEIATKINEQHVNRFKFIKGNICALPFENDFFDVTFCWQTLSWLDYPKEALYELLRVTKNGGKIYASSLFNVDHDVDIYAKVLDYTRESSKEGIYYNYITLSKFTIANWLLNKARAFNIYKFTTPIPFEYSGRGLGTYTKKCEDGYIQISGGMLLNWGILEIEK